MDESDGFIGSIIDQELIHIIDKNAGALTASMSSRIKGERKAYDWQVENAETFSLSKQDISRIEEAKFNSISDILTGD